MTVDHQLQLEDLPPLPKGCPELRATASPDSDTRLQDHIEQLPGLDEQRVRVIADIAAGESNPSGSQVTADSPVLGLDDLLRDHSPGTRSLHPRVLQVTSLEMLDPLLKGVTECMDERPSLNAYQYPEKLLQCSGTDPAPMALYPPEYHIRTLDVARDLRALPIVTSVERPGDESPDWNAYRGASVTGTYEMNEILGVARLYFDDESNATFYAPKDNVFVTSPGLVLAACASLIETHSAPDTELKPSDVAYEPYLEAM